MHTSLRRAGTFTTRQVSHSCQNQSQPYFPLEAPLPEASRLASSERMAVLRRSLESAQPDLAPVGRFDPAHLAVGSDGLMWPHLDTPGFL